MRHKSFIAAGLVAVIFLLSGPAPGADGTTTAPARTCAICDKSAQPEWRYCPYDGHPLLPQSAPVADNLSPTEVLHLLATSYTKRDREGIARALDLEGILGALMKEGLASLDAVDPGVRVALDRRFRRRAAAALVPIVLDAMVSDDMQTEWRLLSEDLTSENVIRQIFAENITGNRAQLQPISIIDRRAITFHLQDGQWKIVSFPQIGL